MASTSFYSSTDSTLYDLDHIINEIETLKTTVVSMQPETITNLISALMNSSGANFTYEDVRNIVIQQLSASTADNVTVDDATAISIALG